MRLSYSNVAATAALVLCATGTAIAATGGAASQVSRVCADGSGNLSLPLAGGRCRRHGQLKQIAATSSASPVTQLTSPDGRFTVVVSNTGITLSGPQTSLKLTDNDLAMSSAQSTSLTSGTTLTFTGGTTATITAGSNLNLQGGDAAELDGGNSTAVETNGTETLAAGSKLNLGGTGCTKAVARVGDPVLNGKVAGGSSVAFSC